MKIIEELEKEIEDYRKVLRKENTERQIDNLIELLYDKLSDEDLRIFEISDIKTKLKVHKEYAEKIKELKEMTGCDSERTIVIENHDLNKIIDKIFIQEERGVK